MPSDPGDALGRPNVTPEELNQAFASIRGIVRVEWHQNMPGQFRMTFENDQWERMPGNGQQAAELAQDLGFLLVSDPDEPHLAVWELPSTTEI